MNKCRDGGKATQWTADPFIPIRVRFLAWRFFYVFTKHSSYKLLENSVKIYKINLLTCTFFDKINQIVCGFAMLSTNTLDK
jgi:hypothetical protein